MEKKQTSLLVVSIGKALNGIPPAFGNEQLAITIIKQIKNALVL